MDGFAVSEARVWGDCGRCLDRDDIEDRARGDERKIASLSATKMMGLGRSLSRNGGSIGKRGETRDVHVAGMVILVGHSTRGVMCNCLADNTRGNCGNNRETRAYFEADQVSFCDKKL